LINRSGTDSVLVVILSLFTTFVSVILFSCTANLVALPFNDLLARAAEGVMEPPLAPPPMANRWQELKLIWVDAKKTILVLLLLLLCLSVAWVPILNIAALVCSWLLMTFQYISFPQTRRGIGSRESVKVLLSNSAAGIGCGIVLCAGFAIPLLAFIIHPIGIVSGVLLFGRIDSNKSASRY
jgi:uncharacterized protein involved in cysteine biosynthesis